MGVAYQRRGIDSDRVVAQQVEKALCFPLRQGRRGGQTKQQVVFAQQLLNGFTPGGLHMVCFVQNDQCIGAKTL